MSISPNSNNKSNGNGNDDSHDDGAPAIDTDDTIHFITPPPDLSSTSLQHENALCGGLLRRLVRAG